MALTSVSCQQTAVLFFFLTLFLTSTVSCSKHNIHYSTHCASFVPESTHRNPESTTIPFPLNQDGFFTGGDGIRPSSSQYYDPSGDRRSLLFVTHNVYTTNVQDIYKVQASLIVQFYAMSYYVEDVAFSYSYSPEVLEEVSESGPWRFTFEGFWSKSSGKLCMVGSSKFKLPKGNIRLLAAVLKIYDIRTSNTITNLVRGTMHSLSSVGDMHYFEPMNLLMFPKMNYKYSEGLKESGHSCSGRIDVSKSDSLDLPLSIPICSIFSSQEINSFDLEYIDGCSSVSNCSPLGEGVGFLPQLMSLSLVQCSNDRRSMRFLLQFPNRKYVSYNEPLVPSTTLVAEGSWDANRNHLCAVACRILDANKSLSTSHIEDCSIRMSLRFPAFWSIGNTNSIIGNIWSVKPSNVPGYFSVLSFKIQYHEVRQIPGLRYNYTLVDKARILCPKKFPSPNRRNQYPDENSNEWRFDMSFPNSNQVNTGWGNSEPIFIGDQPASSNMNPFLASGNAKTHVEESDKKQLKMSHRMMFPFYDASVGDHLTVGFVAEGIYDTETGELCMVGCRFLDNNQKSADNSMDCENLVKLKFPPLDSRDHIQGRLECKRETSDPLYYEAVIFSAVSPYRRIGRQSINRMDSEVIMSLLSSTLVCAFVAYQIFYLKKNPVVITLISLLMLVILTFGQMIPMVTNFDALLSFGNDEKFPRRTAGRLEVNEVLLKFLTLLAFLFQFRLLQIIWSRSPDGNEKVAFLTAEKKTVCVSMLLYVCGGLTASSAHWKNYKFSDDNKNYGHGRNDDQYSLWKDFQSYYGLLMDGFLLPQILLNIFCNSREVALSRSFYLGITLVQMLPHAYDLYRVHYFNKDFDWSYKYANPTTDYYSSAWDVFIVVGSLVFAAILHLQQQFGGRFFLPRRFREPEGYDKLPVQSEA